MSKYIGLDSVENFILKNNQLQLSALMWIVRYMLLSGKIGFTTKSI